VPQNVRFFERQKFLWDGETYDAAPAAAAKKIEYETQGFETQLAEEEGQVFLYTRRVVKEVVVAGEPPPM